MSGPDQRTDGFATATASRSAAVTGTGWVRYASTVSTSHPLAASPRGTNGLAHVLDQGLDPIRVRAEGQHAHAREEAPAR